MEIRAHVSQELWQRPAELEVREGTPPPRIRALARRLGLPAAWPVLVWRPASGGKVHLKGNDHEFLWDAFTLALNWCTSFNDSFANLREFWARWGPLWLPEGGEMPVAKAKERLHALLFAVSLAVGVLEEIAEKVRNALQAAHKEFPSAKGYTPRWLGRHLLFLPAAPDDWLRVPPPPDKFDRAWWQWRVVVPAISRILERGVEVKVRRYLADKPKDYALVLTWCPRDAYTLAVVGWLGATVHQYPCSCGCGRPVARKGAYFEPACRKRAYRLRHPEEAVKSWLKEKAKRGEIANLSAALEALAQVMREMKGKLPFEKIPEQQEYQEMVRELEKLVARRIGMA